MTNKILFFLLSLLFCVSLVVFLYDDRAEHFEELVTEANFLASAVNPSDLHNIDVLQKQLARIKQSNKDIAFICIVGKKNNQNVCIAETNPNQHVYIETLEYKKAWEGQTQIENLVDNKFGDYITVFAPIFKDNTVVAVMSLSIERQVWAKKLLTWTVLPITITLLIVIIIAIAIGYCKFLAKKQQELSVFYAALEHSEEPICIIDKKGFFKAANKKYCDLYGTINLRGKNIKELKDSDLAMLVERCFAEQKVITSNISYNLPIYGKLIFSTKLYPVKDNLNVVVCIGFDITEQKQIESALLQTNLLANQAFDLAHLAYWSFDLDNYLFSLDNKYYCLLGYDVQSDTCKYNLTLEEWLQTIHPDDRLLMKHKINRAVVEENFNCKFVQIRFAKKNGTYIDCHCNYFISKSKKIMYGIIQDISDRKKDELALIESQKMDSIGNLVAGIAHDFNNLLAILNLNKTLLEESIETHLTEQDRCVLSNIERAANSMGDLINKLRLFNSRENRPNTVIDVKDLVQDCYDLIRRSAKSISISCKFEHTNKITCDPIQIRQVLINLMVNAIEAIGLTNTNGKIEITTYEKNNNVCVSIKDNGCGIVEEVKHKIFSPYFTTKKNPNTQGKKGTGLGLAICYAIMRNHNGEIEFNSQYQQGTEFILKFKK